MAHKPTEEQVAILDAFPTGDNLVIEAGAGSGKTSTLEMLAAATPNQTGLYLAYNRAIKEEAKRRFPGSVTCMTNHGMAYAPVGSRYKRRLGGARVPAQRIAALLRINQALRLDDITLQPKSIARLVNDTVANFCRSADAEIGRHHVPVVNGLEAPAARAAVAQTVLPYAVKAWADLQGTSGDMPFTHDVYLKMFQLTGPVLSYDYLLVDEAQDLNPVVKAIVDAQQAQVVLVGDRCQAIYGWRGAIDAMQKAEGKRLYLSQSFRFGPAIAAEANKWLEVLAADLRLSGFDKVPSTLGKLDAPDAILCRTNAGALSRVMKATERGVRVGLVGGGAEIGALARAAADLLAGRGTDHPELMAFGTWAQVQDYAENDSAGSDLKVFVNMVDDHGPETLIAVVDRLVDERSADLVVSTAHKAKGREWNKVQVAGDFKAPKRTEGNLNPQISREDAMLAYVTVTRAKLVLDRGGLDFVDDFVTGTSPRSRAIAALIAVPVDTVPEMVAPPVEEPAPAPAPADPSPAHVGGFLIRSKVVYINNRAPQRPVFTVLEAYPNQTVGWVYALEQPDGRQVRGISHQYLELAPGAQQPVAVQPVQRVQPAKPAPAPVVIPAAEPLLLQHCRRCGSDRCQCGRVELARWLALTTAGSAAQVVAAVAGARS